MEDVEELKERNPVGVAWVEVVGQEGVEVVVTVGMTGVEASVGKVEVVVEEGKVQGRVERVSEYLFVVCLETVLLDRAPLPGVVLEVKVVLKEGVV